MQIDKVQCVSLNEKLWRANYDYRKKTEPVEKPRVLGGKKDSIDLFAAEDIWRPSCTGICTTPQTFSIMCRKLNWLWVKIALFLLLTKKFCKVWPNLMFINVPQWLDVTFWSVSFHRQCLRTDSRCLTRTDSIPSFLVCPSINVNNETFWYIFFNDLFCRSNLRVCVQNLLATD